MTDTKIGNSKTGVSIKPARTYSRNTDAMLKAFRRNFTEPSDSDEE